MHVTTETEHHSHVVAIDVGLDSDYFHDSNSNHINVPKKIVQRLGGAGKTTEMVTADEPNEILQRAAAASLLQVDAGEKKVALHKTVTSTRSAMKQHRDEIRDQLDVEAAYDVMSSSM